MNRKIFIFILGFVLVFTPFAFSYAGIVPECNTGPIDKDTGQYVNACDFDYFMKLINKVIEFLLFKIATPLLALIIMYVAYIYLTSGGSSEKVGKAKHIFFNVVIGYIVALGAWLLISAILSSLGVDESTSGMFLDK